MEKKWRTAITQHVGHETYIRGYRLLDLVGNLSYAQAVYLILKGELPNEKESKMMEAILVSVIDHGIAPPSVIAARAVASGGNSLNVGVAAGILAFGSAHGGALEDAMRFIQEGVSSTKSVSEIVREYLESKKPIPGYGHRYYKDYDPRTKRLMDIAKDLGFYGKHCQFAEEVQEEIARQKGKRLVLNVDGAIAAVASEMGFDWRLGKGFFIIGRVAGLVAHVYEELTTEKPFSKRLDEETETEYTGTPPRELPPEFRRR
ncbi:citrate synthase [Thermocrinis albus DSM 14484]|uniref:citrate synthase (unknown stereospecificity) n=2 Tax=Thermocrinis TaxID=75905 RepID=D3SMV4_THEAH|nr:citryl-CoA lyase [Thermocrinis albus]ADC90084.1 citrate synthase [Thermocrinis albus DSM 14484]